MDRATGTVRSLVSRATGPHAVVDVDVNAVCARCAAGKGCGAGLLAGSGKVRQVEASIEQETRVEVGDRVGINLRPADLLHAAMIVYLPPLVAAAIAAGLTSVFTQRDIDTAAAALLGLAVGLFASRYYLNHFSCLDRFVPVIDRVLPPEPAAS